MDIPLVSVIIPAYNAEGFIEETLNSVLSQTYKNIEVLVIDDGSQDRTAELVKLIAAKDLRVRLLQQANAGVSAARNLGIEKSQGEYIAPLDADDIWYPQNLEKKVNCLLESDASVGLVYAWSVDINEAGFPNGQFRASTIEGDVYTTLVCHDFIGNASATMMRRSSVEKVGGYNCSLKEKNVIREDWELYLRLAEFYQFRVVPEFLVGYRRLEKSMSGDCQAMARSQVAILQTIQEKHPEIPGFIFRLSSGSFYIYLARQNYQWGTPQDTLFWLFQALGQDGVITLLRYGFYKMLLSSLFQLITQGRTEAISSRTSQQLTLNPLLLRLLQGTAEAQRPQREEEAEENKRGYGSGLGRKFQSQNLTISETEQWRSRIRFRLFVGNTLHRLLPKINRTPLES